MITLSPYAQELLNTSMPWMDRLYDDEAGLLWHPVDGTPPESGQHGDQHMVRDSTYYALGLLMRDGLGDRQRAERILHVVLDQQILEPEAPFHGTFLRTPEEPRPGFWAREWRDYDPNWRDFIGTGFALALIHFEELLPRSLILRIEESFRKAVEGALMRRVSPGYTNIALMDAYLLYFAGERLGAAEWQQAGERLAQQVYDLFQANRAFAEYNSPTYYGVDFYALALWRGHSTSRRLNELGAEMEADLWRDVAQFYHAGLRNLAGPWARSYGMDMQRYAALLGLWIWLLVGREKAPFPDTTQPFEHSADLCFATVIALVGAQAPETCVPSFEAFQEAHLIEHVVNSEPRWEASAWLAEEVMLGGAFTSQQVKGSAQFHPLTMHWRTQSGQVGWARLIHTQALDVRAKEGQLQVTGQGPLDFEIYSPGTLPEQVQSDQWQLNGLLVRLDGATTSAQVSSQEEDRLQVHYPYGEEQVVALTLQVETD